MSQTFLILISLLPVSLVILAVHLLFRQKRATSHFTVFLAFLTLLLSATGFATNTKRPTVARARYIRAMTEARHAGQDPQTVPKAPLDQQWAYSKEDFVLPSIWLVVSAALFVSAAKRRNQQTLAEQTPAGDRLKAPPEE